MAGRLTVKNQPFHPSSTYERHSLFAPMEIKMNLFCALEMIREVANDPKTYQYQQDTEQSSQLQTLHSNLKELCVSLEPTSFANYS